MIDFDEFWPLYPRKVAKKAARKAWDKLKPDQELFDKIKEDIEQRIAFGLWTTDKFDFIPHAATYLNGERYEDEHSIPPNLGEPTAMKDRSVEADLLDTSWADQPK